MQGPPAAKGRSGTEGLQIAEAFKKKVEAELDRLERTGFITKAFTATGEHRKYPF